MSASGFTHLQIVNRVLARLRESSVAAYNTTEYSTLISALVNQVKAEIEEAYYWNSMRDTYTVNTSTGVIHYALTSAGSNAVVIDAWNTTTGYPLARGTNADFNRRFFGVGNAGVLTGPPTEFVPAGVDDNFDFCVDVWPQPTASANVLKFNVYAPQADLTLDATVPLCPQNVLIEETIARAKAERGDDDAQQADPSSPSGKFIRTDLLASAVARESGHDPEEMTWIVV